MKLAYAFLVLCMLLITKIHTSYFVVKSIDIELFKGTIISMINYGGIQLRFVELVQ